MSDKDQKRQKAMELLESLDSMDLLLMMQELKARKEAKQDTEVEEASAPVEQKPLEVHKPAPKRKKQVRQSENLVPSNGPRRGIDKKAGKGMNCRTESFYVGPRPNLFLEMSDYDAHKEDTKIDKLLHVQKPVPRRAPAELVEVECGDCGVRETVSPKLLGHGITYICNNCSRRG